MVGPYALPSLDPEQVSSHNELFGLARHFSFPFSGSTGVVRFTGWQAGGEIPGRNQSADEWAARLRLGSRQLWIVARDLDQLPPLRAMLGEMELERFSYDVRPALLESVFAELLDQASALGWGRAEIDEVVACDQLPESLATVTFRLTLDHGPFVDGAVRGDDNTVAALGKLLQGLAVTSTEQIDRQAIPFPVEIGRQTLTVDELQSLRRYDVVLLETDGRIPSSHGLLCLSPSNAWQVALNGQQVALDVPALTPVPTPLTHTTVELIVSFQSGTVDIPIGSLAELHPGALLAWRPHHNIVVSVDQTVIATGELVEIAGRWGVRLTEMGVGSPEGA